jgi:hypothetical protein
VTRVPLPEFPDTGPRSQRTQKRLRIDGGAEAEARVTKRIHKLLLKGYSARDAALIGGAPTKAERTALKAQFTRTALDRVQKVAMREALVAKGYGWARKRPKRKPQAA